MKSLMNFHHFYQPIINSEREEPLGFEALIRHPDYQNLGCLFQTARDRHALIELDLLSIKRGIEKARHVNVKQFINVFPQTLITQMFYEVISTTSLPSNIMFEINETPEDFMIWDQVPFKQRLEELTRLNIKWGIDDVGKGASSLHKILELSPNFIKLDIYFGKQLACSRKKQQVISYLTDFCQSEKIMFILEGIETKVDYEVACELGVLNSQGFYFGKPKLTQEYQKSANKKRQMSSKIRETNNENEPTA